MAANIGSVKVVFFASLREAVDCESLEISAATLGELMKALQEHLSATGMAALASDNVRVALNQQLLDSSLDWSSVTLQNHDEVAFLPPVTGG